MGLHPSHWSTGNQSAVQYLPKSIRQDVIQKSLEDQRLICPTLPLGLNISLSRSRDREGDDEDSIKRVNTVGRRFFRQVKSRSSEKSMLLVPSSFTFSQSPLQCLSTRYLGTRNDGIYQELDLMTGYKSGLYSTWNIQKRGMCCLRWLDAWGSHKPALSPIDRHVPGHLALLRRLECSKNLEYPILIQDIHWSKFQRRYEECKTPKIILNLFGENQENLGFENAFFLGVLYLHKLIRQDVTKMVRGSSDFQNLGHEEVFDVQYIILANANLFNLYLRNIYVTDCPGMLLWWGNDELDKFQYYECYE
ncbi:hypothetical protein WN51_07964 [Melipona quadrifasciata]|uniref:Uncharacterized protein n=1 Tax=Melipona quadrifasciata TaxID=166423 RepID=A0A0M8ZRQ0_9HYME|nr:hypothetical protein WN51_07964 [Melipona quadrifasciata]